MRDGSHGKLLNRALDIRHNVSGFDDLAHELNLVSLNAQVSSVRIGSIGEAFRVLTEETSRISDALTRLVSQVRDLTGRWTALSARAVRNEKRIDILRRAPAYRQVGHNASLIQAEAQFMTAIAEAESESPGFIRSISEVADEMNKSLRLINYVTSGIMIESSRLTSDAVETEALQHLAGKMQSTADSIRGVAARIVGDLKDLTRG